MKHTEAEPTTELDPGTASRSDVLNETPEEKEARVQREIDAGLRAPPPEIIDQTKSGVTGAQVRAMEDAAPKPHAGDVPDNGNGKKASAKKTASKK